MKMDSLRELHQSMRSMGLDMQQFALQLGVAEFDCLFSTRSNPFTFSMTSRGRNPSFFKFEVLPGYWIKDYLGDMYGPLVDLLKIDGRSRSPLKPKEFLADLDARIPRQAQARRVPEPHIVIRLRSDLEEAERPYFDAWIYWDDPEKRSPTEENKLKTLEALGPEALKYSNDMNASSKWSVNETGRTWKTERRKT
ncbi:hypothetical protein AYI87_11090 [Shewanella sp. KCT]|nr:hypothetical protein AYI87_11090 [Shewanella sp. KCT]